VRILLLTEKFPPEIAGTRRAMDQARLWAASGHDVTVLTQVPNQPAGVIFPGWRNRPWQVDRWEGARVIRIWTHPAPNTGVFRRTLDYVSYAVSATVQCWRLPPFDVILASSPQIFVAVAGLLISVLRRRPWVFEIRDLWPDSIRAVGATKSPLLRLVERMELFLYARSDRIVVVTEAFRDNLVSRGVPAEKIDVVRNGIDLDVFSRDRVPGRARALLRSRLGLRDDVLLAAYIGTTGAAHGLDTILDAAALLRERSDVHFLILGEGAERKALEARARELGLANLSFHDFVPQDDVADYIAAVDVSLVHLRDQPLFRTVIPSKIFEIMAMENPMVLGVEGESAAIVQEAEAGLCVPPEDPRALADAVVRLVEDPALRARLGANGLAHVRAHYDRRVLAGRVLETFEEVTA
jgi:colanic acid biosynthesis glycosyl transferase WcaI